MRISSLKNIALWQLPIDEVNEVHENVVSFDLCCFSGVVKHVEESISNHLKRNKLTIVANNKNSTFDRNYEGQTLSCYIISYLIHAIFQDILCILRK